MSPFPTPLALAERTQPSPSSGSDRPIAPLRAVQFPIDIGLNGSRLLFIFLVSLHSVAAGCLVALPWPLILRCVLLVLVGMSLAHALRASRVVGLRLAGPNRLDCLLADGSRVAAKALPGSAVFAQLIVVRLRIGEEERATSLTLLPDQMSAQQFRLLRLWLRWQVEPKDDAGTAF